MLPRSAAEMAQFAVCERERNDALQRRKQVRLTACHMTPRLSVSCPRPCESRRAWSRLSPPFSSLLRRFSPLCHWSLGEVEPASARGRLLLKNLLPLLGVLSLLGCGSNPELQRNTDSPGTPLGGAPSGGAGAAGAGSRRPLAVAADEAVPGRAPLGRPNDPQAIDPGRLPRRRRPPKSASG